MESENATCGVCAEPYDTKDHSPRVLINCGHTLCTYCLKEILKTPNLRKCPFDSILFKKTQKSLDHFPNNYALLGLLDGKHPNICEIHGDQLTILCLKEKTRICRDCALFGEHKGHAMKKIKDLRAQGIRMKKDLAESLLKFKKYQLEKEQEVCMLEEEFLEEMKNKFKEIRDILKAKELKWTKEAENLFERNLNGKDSAGLLLIEEAEKALEEIDQAGRNEENLDALDQDFSSIISEIQRQCGEEEIVNLSIKGSGMMDCMNLFFMEQKNLIKNFDLLNGDCIENARETKQKSPDMSLSIEVKNQNPIDSTPNKLKKVSIEFNRYDSLDDLSEILHRPGHFTSLAASFAPEGLTDDSAVHLLNILFCKIQHLTEIEISFEQSEITNQPILFFCKNLLPKANCLRNLTLNFGFTLLNDESLFALAKSLSFLSKKLESFTLEAGHTAITDNGIKKLFPVVWEVKELDLQLQGTLMTDGSLKALGNHMMLCMKNLEKFSLDVSDTKITIEGISVIFAGIPKGIKLLNLGFEKVEAGKEEIVVLFEEKVVSKLGLAEEVELSLGRGDLEAKVSKLLKRNARNETEKTEEEVFE